MSRKKDKLQIRVPVLKHQSHVFSCKTALSPFLGTKHLNLFIEFQVYCPILLPSADPVAPPTVYEAFFQKPLDFFTQNQLDASIPQRFPVFLMEETIRTNDAMIIFHLELHPSSRYIVPYLTSGKVCIVDQ